MQNNMNQGLVITNLHKIYDDGNDKKEAIKDISLTINKGDFFALLGPNGAGKSTLIGIVCGLVKKTGGTVTVEGYDIDTHAEKSKLHLGLVPQEFNFDIFSTVENILFTQAGYYGISRSEVAERVSSLLKQLGLEDKRKIQAMKLSGGMKRRLMIARALVHNPTILFLDEPTAGVDVELRNEMWVFLKQLNKEGVTIILTTHYLEEAEELCKHVAIISKGEIQLRGTMEEVRKGRDLEDVYLEVTK